MRQVITATGKDGNEWRELVNLKMIEFNTAIFTWPCVLSDHPPALVVDYHQERCGMPLHDAVGIN